MKIYTYLTGLVFVLFLFTVSVNAQIPQFSVANKAGATGVDRAHDIAVNSNGEVYIITEFTGTVDFGGGVILTSRGNVDYALIKYDSSGNTLWGKAGGSAGTSSSDRGRAVAIDNQGNVYAAGEYFITAVFGTDTLTSAGNFDTFLIKYDNAGNRIWIRDIKGVSQVAPRSLAVDANNNIIITGYFGSTSSVTVTLDSITLTTNGNRDIFVAKYNSAGDVQWAKNFGGINSGEEGRDLTVDADGNIYVTGIITGTANFGDIVLNGNLGTDVFVTKLSPSGNVLWAKHGGGNRADDGAGVALDNLGNVYVVGKYDSAAVFGPFSVDRNGKFDAFLLKMSSTGDFLSFTYAGGDTINDYASDVICDRLNNVYVVGYFSAGTSYIAEDTLISAGGDDIYVWSLAPNGSTTYVKHILGNSTDRGFAIDVDFGGNLYVTGTFQGTCNFDSFVFTGAGGDDIFYGRIGNNPVPVELLSFNASVDGMNVRLNWTTATEINNSGFEIERSTDNVAFETLAFISGNGTTTERKTYSFTDNNLISDLYYYRLKQIDFDGTFSYSSVVEVNLEIPSVYNLSQNYPNPFNPSTEISFAVPVDAAVTISVFNAVGEKVNEFSKDYSAGSYKYNFNGNNLSSGIYFYSINAAGKDGSVFSSSKKMALIK
jgi:hypothetical protein